MKKYGIPLLDEFLLSFGSLENDPLCPELRAWNTRDFSGLWKRALALDGNAPVPYWGIVWPGGRGMARFILDNKKLFRKRRLLDIGTGSGISAVAAAMAGAAVTGLDIDPAAVALAARTAADNGVNCRFSLSGIDDISDEMLGAFDIIMACDIFNKQDFAVSTANLVRRGMRTGLHNYLSDSGRSHRPTGGTENLRTLRVPVFREIEGVTEREVKIFRFTG